jgi:hypothetical protein
LDILAKAGQPEAAERIESNFRAQIQDLTQETQQLKTTLRQERSRTHIREVLTGFNPVKLDDAVTLFLQYYSLLEDEESGEYTVADTRGNPLTNDITYQPLRLNDAAELFFKERQFLVQQQSKGDGLRGLGALRGSPQSRSNEDLKADYLAAFEGGDKDKANVLRREMVKRSFEGS